MSIRSQRSEYHYDLALPQEPDDRDEHATAPNEQDPTRITKNAPRANEDKPLTQTLQRSSLTIWIVVLYSALAIFSWVIIVYLVFHPITNSHLRYHGSQTGRFLIGPDEINHLYAQNEQWVQTARVLMSFAGVLSIPVASATCAGAAPVYSQRRAKSRDLSLRQVMMLADRCWTNPLTYIHAVGSKKGYRRYGSPFLLVAIVIHFLAFLVSPLQQIETWQPSTYA
ncbi:hypothetical protein PHISCL_00970 [Aspergillus sclerotialis]|uniref:Uncharacterized protein n=1 Tax=Aspergillus sclerotialis TaxID=2070753 RepID=A0A3A2ZU87_9EURO|nr:hypothetical protein PHISCL_00970 [Aspergillus sclerotialis]